jgi:hypothetical protein
MPVTMHGFIFSISHSYFAAMPAIADLAGPAQYQTGSTIDLYLPAHAFVYGGKEKRYTLIKMNRPWSKYSPLQYFTGF